MNYAYKTVPDIMQGHIHSKKEIQRDFSGQRFGRWTVLDNCETNTKGERKWLCQCDCGTVRYVLERSLVYGGSKSCGCLRKERAREASALDLTGKTFGELTVLHSMPDSNKSGGVRWLCRCSCGKECVVSGTLLATGRKTHCPNHQRNYFYKDITGQRFHRLTALYPSENQDGRGVIWHCRCDCGNEIDVSYNSLVYCNLKSCGCQKKEHDQKLTGLLTHVDGTSIDAIRSHKTPSNNTTGYRGVYKIRGKYTAKIVFRKKQYFLGTFDNLETAAEARRKAESLLFDDTVDYYEKWKAKADADPEWAVNNPIHFDVNKDDTGTFRVVLLPNID